MLFASRGHRVLGVDSSPLAVEKAGTKAKERGSKAQFMVADALDLAQLDRRFDAAIDSGLFHVFPDRERAAYVRSLAAVLRPGGRYFMLCFSEMEPADWGGPRRISESEILESFREGWHIDYVRRAGFESNFHSDAGHAWFARVSKAP